MTQTADNRGMAKKQGQDSVDKSQVTAEDLEQLKAGAHRKRRAGSPTEKARMIKLTRALAEQRKQQDIEAAAAARDGERRWRLEGKRRSGRGSVRTVSGGLPGLGKRS